MYTYKALLMRVIDGDTIEVMVDLGFNVLTKQVLRLNNIDTAEIYRPTNNEEKELGIEAKKFVEDFIGDSELTIKTNKTGKYGRWLADVFVEGESLNEALVDNGFSKPDRFK